MCYTSSLFAQPRRQTRYVAARALGSHSLDFRRKGVQAALSATRLSRIVRQASVVGYIFGGLDLHRFVVFTGTRQYHLKTKCWTPKSPNIKRCLNVRSGCLSWGRIGSWAGGRHLRKNPNGKQGQHQEGKIANYLISQNLAERLASKAKRKDFVENC